MSSERGPASAPSSSPREGLAQQLRQLEEFVQRTEREGDDMPAEAVEMIARLRESWKRSTACRRAWVTTSRRRVATTRRRTNRDLSLTPARHDDRTRVTLSLILIAAMFMGSGILHIVKPALYVSIMPPWLPAPLMLVLVSGVLEMLGAAGVLIPFTREAAGWGLIALLVAVFPANIQMLMANTNPSWLWKAGLIARLPLQAVLIYWVYRAAVRSGR